MIFVSLTQNIVLTSTGNTVLSGIALEIEQDGEVPAIDETDYYSLYTNGRSIEINGVEYNIADGREAVLVNLADLEIDHLNTDGMIFIDNAGFEGAKEMNGRYLTPDVDNVIIGRYATSQPRISFGSNQFTIRRDAVLKNLNISSTNGQAIISNTGADGPFSLTIEDCTLSTTGQGIIRDGHATTTFANIYIINSIIEFPAGINTNVYTFSFSANKTDMAIKSVKVVNNVIYAPEEFNLGVVNIGYNAEIGQTLTDDVDIEVSDNTLYNATATNVIARAYHAKSLVVNDNVAYNTSVNKRSYLTALYDDQFTCSNIEILGNYLYTPYVDEGTDGIRNYWGLRNRGSYTVDNSRNTLNEDASEECILTDQVNLETGYIPVNTNVVTNGAGADLSTKLWLNQ